MPKAINSIMWRVGLFYVGSVVLLAMLLPWSAYSADESPFVTVLSNIGIPAAGGVMNLVVLTAAMSSLNSGLYSTGRILRSMAMSGSAPQVHRRDEPQPGPVRRHPAHLRQSASWASASTTSCPSDAFEIVLNFAAIGILATWAHDHDLSSALLAEGAGRASSPGPATGCPARRGPRSSRWPSSPPSWS